MKKHWIAFLSCLLLVLPCLWAQTTTTPVSITTACVVQLNVVLSNPSCPNGDDGFIELDLVNDDGTTSLNWLNLPVAVVDETQPSALEAGIYRLEVSDASGCRDTVALQLNNPAPRFNASLASDDVLCFGEQNGRIDLVIDRPANVRRYFLNGEPHAATANTDQVVFEDLEPGQYEVLIEDIQGCFQEDFALILEPEKLELEFAQKNVTCPDGDDGEVELTARGGVGDYRYSVDGQNFFGERLFKRLKARQYELFVKDRNECVTLRSVFLQQPEAPTVSFTKEDVSCPRGSDASFIVIIETGSRNENYEFSLDGQNYQEDSTFTDLAAGFYNVHYRNPDLCVATVPILVEEPEEPQMEFKTEDVSCPQGKDGSFIVIIETGSRNDNFDYSIDGTNYQADSLFSDLEAGVYTAYARNELQCISTAKVEVKEPSEPNVQLHVEAVSCPGSSNGQISVDVTPTDGVQYSLDRQSFQQSPVFEGLSGGFYTVFIQNSAGCLEERSTFVDEPVLPQIRMYIRHIDCFGDADGSIEAVVENARHPLAYSLDGQNFQDSESFTGLLPNQYTLFIRDAAGCIYQANTEISEPDSLSVTLSVGHSTCGFDNGFIAATVEGGTPVYQYRWSHGATEAVLTNLSPGQYQLTVVDDQNCHFEQGVTVEDQAAPLLRAETRNASCQGTPSGRIELEAASGIGVQEVRWSTGDVGWMLDNLTAGQYSVTVTDYNQCQSAEEYIIEEPEHLTAQGQITQSGNTADIELSVEGGTFPYRYVWEGGHLEPDLWQVPPGEYTVTITDANNCQMQSQFVIEAADRPLEENILIYPIPTDQYLRIQLDLPITQSVAVDLLDNLGRLLIHLPAEDMRQGLLTFDLELLASGVYYVRIAIDEETFARRIVKTTH